MTDHHLTFRVMTAALILMGGLNVMLYLNNAKPQEAVANPAVSTSAAAQRKAIQVEIAGLRTDVAGLKTALTDGSARVTVVGDADND